MNRFDIIDIKIMPESALIAELERRGYRGFLKFPVDLPVDNKFEEVCKNLEHIHGWLINTNVDYRYLFAIHTAIMAYMKSHYAAAKEKKADATV